MHNDAKSTEAAVAEGRPIVPRFAAPPQYVSDSLKGAETLLKYAAETGVEIDAGIREKVLRASAVGPAACDERMVADLLQALAQLSARLKPVTVESLGECASEEESQRVLKKYVRLSIVLAVVILVFSVSSFITTALSKNINAKIDESNQLAATLRSELGDTNSSGAAMKDPSQPPAGISAIDLITQLQTYASNIREIDSRSKQLNRFIFGSGKEYYLEQINTNSQTNHVEFQLPIGLPNYWQAEQGRTFLYQHVRTFAQTVVNDVSLYYGAVLTCILPVCYALFGTCAYFLRKYEQRMAARTFVTSSSDSAHFIVAGICGAVVGLFNVTLAQEISVSPLAIAFLVGYGVDVFFSYLESFLQVFKGKT
ncbi:MAG TPA: hypothetical protein VGJ73_14930 [Verrucomicrobiae bacterium]